jgi:hypothetical protein
MQLGLDPTAYWRCEDLAERAFLKAVLVTAQRQRREADELATLKARAREHGAA